jgi:transposase
LSTDRLYGHVVKTKDRTAFLTFVRYLRRCTQPEVRIAIVLDNFSPHLATKKDQRVAEWAAANNVELAYTPTYSSWLNRIEAQFTSAALLRPRWHRPPQPPRTSIDDPPLHPLAQPPRTRPSTTELINRANVA